MTDLDKLIEAVERGDDDGVCGLKYRILAATPFHIGDAYHGSLDAAKALHDALLTDWGYKIEAHTYGAMAHVGRDREMLYSHHGVKTIPARAWLLAILKAYRGLQ